MTYNPKDVAALVRAAHGAWGLLDIGGAPGAREADKALGEALAPFLDGLSFETVYAIAEADLTGGAGFEE